METCVNTKLLQKHEEEMEYVERRVEMFLEDIEPYLMDIHKASQRIREIEKEYSDLVLDDVIKEEVEFHL